MFTLHAVVNWLTFVKEEWLRTYGNYPEGGGQEGVIFGGGKRFCLR